MGTWGTSLYANDAAADVRGDYMDNLRNGKTNQEVTHELIEKNRGFQDPAEEALFWFALADVQWNYGRLLPEVKERAMHFLSIGVSMSLWDDAGEKKRRAWQKTLDALKEKLSHPQPPMKKISQYRNYRCKWTLGDVFAYRLTGLDSQKAGLVGRYIVFRKVSESSWYPKHRIPVVEVYQWVGDAVPHMEEVIHRPILGKGLVFPNGYRPEYKMALICTSQKSIPNGQLTFLGNIPGEDLLPHGSNNQGALSIPVGWNSSKVNLKFEWYVIELFTREQNS